MGKPALWRLSLVLFVAACGGSSASDEALGLSDASVGSGADGAPEISPDAAPESSSGSFAVLSYNVAGLPQGVSGNDPAVNTSLMSPLLNAYQLVLVQEDFSYHGDLVSEAEHLHQSTPMQGNAVDVGDGLNRITDFAFTDFARVEWNECNGLFTDKSDCLASKGFSYARHTQAPDVQVDNYN